MAASATTALIACMFLLLSSHSVFAQSGDTSTKKESTSSQQSEDKDKEEKEKADEKKEDEKTEKKAAKETERESRSTILHKIGSRAEEAGSLADALSEDAKKTSMDEAFENADGIEQGNAQKKEGDFAAGRPLVTGALDKAEIQKEIEKHRNQITYCYEKRLVEKPDLAGLVKVKIVIAGTGKVLSSKIKESELGDREVEDCLNKVIRTWTFPEPKGGGIVVVNYPFNFSSTK